MAVKPWIGALKAPSNPPQANNTPPSKTLKIEYVYGYRSEDSRQNVFYSSNSNNVVYMTAALGIVLDKTNNTQQFFGGGDAKSTIGHNDDITALAVNSDRTLVVTGQLGKIPTICVWKSSNCQRVSQFSQDRNTRAVKAVSFSRDSKYIGSVGDDDQHTVFVWTVDGQKAASTKGGPDPILDCAWSPSEDVLATVGKRGITLHTFDGMTLQSSRGLFGDPNINTAMCSAAYGPDGTFYSGGATGQLFVWKGRSLGKTYNIGKGMINGLYVDENQIIVGADSALAVYDTTGKKTRDIPVSSNVRAVDFKDGNIVAGLRDGSIVEVDGSGQVNTLMYSHSDGEAWGLEIDKSGLIVSTGDDNKIVAWDPNTRKPAFYGIVNQQAGQKAKILGASTLSSFPPNQCARSVGINSKNGHVAIGVNNGEVHVRAGIKSLDTTVAVLTESKEWVEVTTYSPDGSKLAVGSHDNNVYIYDVDNNYQLLSRVGGGTSFITSVDWSTDSSYLQLNNGAYEYLFIDVAAGKLLPGGASMLKDEQWTTFSCKLGWPVQGIFPPATDGSHINGVDRSKKKDIFAIGDDWGLVNLYRNPALKGAKPQSYRAHSSHVVRVKFDDKDSRVFSIGGFDRTLIQWKVV